MGVEYSRRATADLRKPSADSRVFGDAVAAAVAKRIREIVAHLADHPDAFARNGAAEVLQNLGILDELLAGVEVEAHGERPSAALRILAAGGPRLRRAAALRNGLDAEQLERLASR